MNVHALVHARIVSALEALQREGGLPDGLDLAKVEVSPPREAAHGDLASNAAMVLAKQARMKPRDIAEKLAEKLKAQPTSRRWRWPAPASSTCALRRASGRPW